MFPVQIKPHLQFTGPAKGLPLVFLGFLKAGHLVHPAAVGGPFQSSGKPSDDHIVLLPKGPARKVGIAIGKDLIPEVGLQFGSPDLGGDLPPPVPFKIGSVYFSGQGKPVGGQPFVDDIHSIASHGKAIRIQGVLGGIRVKGKGRL